MTLVCHCPHDHCIKVLTRFPDESRWHDSCEVGESRDTTDTEQQHSSLDWHIGMRDGRKEVRVLMDGGVAEHRSRVAQPNTGTEQGDCVIGYGDWFGIRAHGLTEWFVAGMAGRVCPQCLAFGKVEDWSIVLACFNQLL